MDANPAVTPIPILANDEVYAVVVPRLLYPPEDAAQMLGVSRSTVYELMAAGKLASVRIGRARRIRHDDLVRFVRALPIEGGEAAS